jgi:hypothetical protein
MGMAVQPNVLAQLGESGRLEGRGVTARFLYALPRSRQGERNLVDAPPVPDKVRREYLARMIQLHRALNDQGDGPFPQALTLHLAPEALDRFEGFQERCERAQKPRGPLHWLPAWGSKLPGQTLRIAGILHLMGRPESEWNDPIDASTMRGSIRIAACLVDHARAVHDLLGQDGPHADARLVLKWLRNHPTETISLRDVYRHVKPLNGKDRAAKAIAILEDYGWLARPVADPDTLARPGRPPSPTWHVHPELNTPDDDDLVDLFDAA